MKVSTIGPENSHRAPLLTSNFYDTTANKRNNCKNDAFNIKTILLNAHISLRTHYWHVPNC